MKKISLAIHGGAGTILKSEMSDTLEKKYLAGLKDALKQGYNHLLAGGSAVESAQLAVCSLEDNSLFNAGKGSVFSSNGTHQMDACIMEGEKLNAGASLIQLYTGFIYNGPALVKNINKEIINNENN